MFLPSGDGTPEETVADTAVATDASEPDSTVDIVETATEETEADATAITTDDEAVATEEIVAGSEGGYSLSPATAEIYTADNPILDNVTPSSDEQHLLVTVSFLAEIASVTINVADVTLIDESGTMYDPIEDGTPLAPYAIGTELTIGESLRGFVVFALPADATPATLQWCPAGNCDALIESPVIVNE